jgi:hypothetical protein
MLHFRLEADSSDVSRAFAVVPGPDDEVLGRINGCGLPGLVLHAGQNRFDVVSSAPAVPAKLLRDFARRAGVHIYGDSGDFICAGGDFVMIYSRSSDSRILSLPGSAKSVLDLMNETEIAANTSEVPYCIPPNMTALWRIIH